MSHKNPLVAILITTILFFNSNSSGEDRKEVKAISIGISTGLTGLGTEAMSKDVLDGIKFANEYFFENKYTLIVEDDQCNSKTGISIAQKFISLDRVKYVLGLLCNQVLLSAAPVYDAAGTVVIAAGATSGDKLDIGQSIFRPYPADHLALTPLVPYIAARHKKVAIITEPDEYTTLLERTFVQTAAKLSLTVVTEQVPPGTSDFRALFSKLRSKGVEAFFLNPLGEPNYIVMVKQLHDLKLNTPLYANLVPGSAVVREALGTLDEGVVYSDLPIATDSLHKDAKRIYEALLAKYGPRRSAPILSLLAIDSLRILDRALQSGKPPAEYIRSTTFPGLVGDLAFDSHGAVIGLAYSLRRIQAQQSVPVKE